MIATYYTIHIARGSSRQDADNHLLHAGGGAKRDASAFRDFRGGHIIFCAQTQAASDTPNSLMYTYLHTCSPDMTDMQDMAVDCQSA